MKFPLSETDEHEVTLAYSYVRFQSDTAIFGSGGRMASYQPHKGDCVMQAKDRSTSPSSAPWNKGKIVGQKRPFKLQEVWAIRIRLQLASRIRDLALFDLAIDSKLRGCDLVALRVSDVAHGQSLSGTWALRWTTPWRSRNKWRYRQDHSLR
jgi:hypothetical protein